MKNKINKKLERQVFSNSKGCYIVPVQSSYLLKSLFLLSLTRLNNNEMAGGRNSKDIHVAFLLKRTPKCFAKKTARIYLD